jgi:DNA-binding NarL/FixJ family response regulator
MKEPDQPRVLLVDDNEAILERATAMLSSRYVVVGAVTNGAAALASIVALHPDVVVLDISMPGMTGLEVARCLHRGGFTIPIVFLTIHDEDELVDATQAAGGLGYVSKGLLATDLVAAVNEACAGRRYVSRLR